MGENKTKIVLEGELSIMYLQDLKDQFFRVLDEYDFVEIEVNKVTSIDISVLQLLCAAHRYACSKDKTLVLNKEISEDFKKAIVAGGFNNFTECLGSEKNGCLWEYNLI